MRYIGIALLLLSAVFIDAAFAKHSREAFSECEGFLLLLRHIKSEISIGGSTLNEWAGRFHNDRLSEVGFIDRLKENADLYDAFTLSSDKLKLPHDKKKLIGSLLSRLGKGALDDEIRLLDDFIHTLECELEHLKKESLRQGGVLRVSVYALSLSVAIILV